MKTIIFEDGTRVEIYKSNIDNKTIVEVNTSETIPSDDDGEAVRIYYNDAMATEFEA